jgi:hypothetical protein
MSAMAAPTFSAQEEAIESGKTALHGNVTDRVVRLFEAIRASYRSRVTLERGCAVQCCR